MRPLKEFPDKDLAQIKYVLTDIDDTLTVDGQLPAIAYDALERLHDTGIKVVPITGRPAGWCDHMARMWPVDGIVGENGAFYFYYQREQHKMVRRYWKSTQKRLQDRVRLDKLRDRILKEVPGARVASDQAYREADLAIDFCEDVPALSMVEIDKIAAIFREAGANAKISSIHVNGWFGSYDKLSMTRVMFREIFEKDLEAIKEIIVFTGDSPNDEPMFDYFPNAVGVANISQFKDRLSSKPAWITSKPAGYGFAELVEMILRRD
jgi:HAD superfamily hydrolase (TIGR01484 family)